MRRLCSVLIGMILCTSALAGIGRSETMNNSSLSHNPLFSPVLRQVDPGQAKATIEFLKNLQTTSGGFQQSSAKPGSSPTASLRATLGAARALHYLGGEVPHAAACSKFVDTCFDSQTGGFSDTPAGKPDVVVTAIGVMAVVDLKMPTEKYAAPVVKHLTEHARSFEEIRLAAAALESLNQESPRNAEWLKQIRDMANSDGTYGKGAGRARATGGAVAAVLRLGGMVPERDKVLEALKKGQRASGGFGKEEAGDGSDLETTYRVMRTFMMLKSQPDDVPALKVFIHKCRNPDGGYGVSPGEPSTASGTYYAAIIHRWLAK